MCERTTDNGRCQRPATRDVDGDLYCDEHADEAESYYES